MVALMKLAMGYWLSLWKMVYYGWWTLWWP